MRYAFLNKLNGWQRLWILASSIYFIVIAIEAIVYFPSSDIFSLEEAQEYHLRSYLIVPEHVTVEEPPSTLVDISRRSGVPLRNLIADYDQKEKRVKSIIMSEQNGIVGDSIFQNLNYHDRWYYLKAYYPEFKELLLDDQAKIILKLKQQKWWHPERAKDELVKILKETRAATRIEQLKHIGLEFLAWIIPCLAVYALGLSLNWVYRGFKKG